MHRLLQPHAQNAGVWSYSTHQEALLLTCSSTAAVCSVSSVYLERWRIFRRFRFSLHHRKQADEPAYWCRTHAAGIQAGAEGSSRPGQPLTGAYASSSTAHGGRWHVKQRGHSQQGPASAIGDKPPLGRRGCQQHQFSPSGAWLLSKLRNTLKEAPHSLRQAFARPERRPIDAQQLLQGPLPDCSFPQSQQRASIVGLIMPLQSWRSLASSATDGHPCLGE